MYSTAAYLIAAGVALVLSMLPKFGALIATIPPGVLGGAGTVLYGMIGMLGVRIWVQNRVDFSNPVNLNTAAVALIVAIANFTWKIGDMSSRASRWAPPRRWRSTTHAPDLEAARHEPGGGVARVGAVGFGTGGRRR